MTAFSSKRRYLTDNRRQQSVLIGGLAIGAIGGLAIPALFTSQLPDAVKTMLLVGSAGCGVGLCGVTGSKVFAKQSKTYAMIENGQAALVKFEMAAELTSAKFKHKMLTDIELLEAIQQLPHVGLQLKYLKELGFTDVAKQLEAALRAQNRPPTQPELMPQTIEAQAIDMSEERAEAAEQFRLKQIKEAETRYRQLYRQSVAFCGKSGEAKTAAAHYWQYCWIKEAIARKEPLPIMYWFDAHYGKGRNPGFESNWLGIPQLQRVPIDIATGVYKGQPHEIEDWLAPVWNLYQRRMKTDEDQPPVIFGIDELTKQLPLMENAQATRVKDMLATLNTGAQKYGIFFACCVHDLTEKETKVPRVVYGQCEVVMGCSMVQDPQQRQNAPVLLRSDAVEIAAEALKLNGKPAGYVTSYDKVTDNYLPLPPMPNAQMILRWQAPKNNPSSPPDTTELMNDDLAEDYWDERLEAKNPGLDVEAEIERQKQQERQQERRFNSLEDLVNALLPWFKSLPSPPTDAQLKAKLLEVTGLQFNEQGVEAIREWLKRASG